MKQQLFIFILFLIFPTQAEIYTCFYNGDDFHVIQDGLRKTYLAQDGFNQSSLGCTSKLAAIYDGDGLAIFDDEVGTFKRVYVNRSFLDSKMVVTENLIGFYDGKEFYIYDSSTKTINRHFADDYFVNAQLVYFDEGIALYDGDDLIVYDNKDKEFHISYVDNGRKNTQLIGVGNGVLFYDGDIVVSYCKSAFSNINAANEKPVQVIGRGKEPKGLVIDEDIFLLDPRCHMFRINGFE